MQEDGYYQRAVEMMARRGFREFMTYVLYNFRDTPQDFYYRLRETVRLHQELTELYPRQGISIASFPMRYQPILVVDSGRDYVGKHWMKEWRSAFSNLRSAHGAKGGQVSCKGGQLIPLDEFEYWFGKSADEFAELLAYPQIRKLMARKKGALRMKRAKVRR